MKSKFQLLALLCMVTLTFNACKKDDPVIVDPPELITTLTYTLTPASGGESVVLTFQDLDGDGGTAPTVSVEPLAANETYTASIAVLNESITPTEDITEEVQEEAEEHQFFFQTNVADLTFAYADEDADGNPLGLATVVSTGAAGSGNMTITLRHEPAKSATGVSNGDIDSAGGETDIEVTFAIDVQ